MRTKNTDYSVFLLVCIALLVLVVAGGVFFYSFSGTTALEEGNERVISTIFIFENNEKPLCSYVVLYCPETRRASVFDVSGDIGRIIKKINRVDRIDTVYDSKNPDSYISEIENLLDVEITYSAVFDLVSLGKVVDLFDGVTISIPQPIEIFDGNDLVLFPAGRITLDGDKTRNYLSYENEESDIEAPRQRRERFFIGFLNKLSEKNDFIKRRDVAGVFRNLIRTNIKGRVSSGLLDELAKIDTDRTSIQTVGGNYREVSGKQLLIPYYDSSLVKDIVKQTLAALTREGVFASSGRVITVEVLNGTNITGLAGRTAELIRVFGYDIIKIGNADRNDYDKTRVIDHIDQKDEAKSFADIIHCNNIITESNNNLETDIQNYEYKADFTLIIGRDFNGRFTAG